MVGLRSSSKFPARSSIHGKQAPRWSLILMFIRSGPRVCGQPWKPVRPATTLKPLPGTSCWRSTSMLLMKMNSASTVDLLLKTGGGSARQGLGNGIHWHIENPVYFVATDVDRQTIPYIKVTLPDGTIKEYVDVQSDFKVADVKSADLIKMDCNTCHNRTSHLILAPAKAMDQLLSRGLISTSIPDIKKKGKRYSVKPIQQMPRHMQRSSVLDHSIKQHTRVL